MSVNEKMTALADSIRAKAGTTGPMGLDAMKTAVDGIPAAEKMLHYVFTCPAGADYHTVDLLSLPYIPAIIIATNGEELIGLCKTVEESRRVRAAYSTYYSTYWGVYFSLKDGYMNNTYQLRPKKNEDGTYDITGIRLAAGYNPFEQLGEEPYSINCIGEVVGLK